MKKRKKVLYYDVFLSEEDIQNDNYRTVDMEGVLKILEQETPHDDDYIYIRYNSNTLKEMNQPRTGGGRNE